MCGIVGIAGAAASRRAGDLADVRRHPRTGAPTTGAPSSRAASASACAASASSTSPAGTSRSRNEDGSVLVVFNGEIYNHEALRTRAGRARAPVPHADATPRSWSTCTRTRASGCSQRLRGMFAFAIWDRRRRRLLRRARPLRSEAAVLHRARRPADVRLRDQGAARATIPSWRALSPFALDQYLTLRFVQAPDTFFEAVRALPPAHFLIWESGDTRIERYWDLSYGPKWTLLRGRNARADRRAARGDRCGST